MRDYDNPDQPAFFTWENSMYSNFMFDLLKVLEPRIQQKNDIVFNELDEVNEVIFFMTGAIDIGFEINRKQAYVLRIDNNILIGAYNVAYNKRTKFIYKAYKECSGFMIRRIDWKRFMYQPEHKTVAGLLRHQIKKDYEIFIMNKVRLEKARALVKWNQRADYDATLRVVENTNFDINAKNHHKHNDSTDNAEHDHEHEDAPHLVNKLIAKFD